MAAGSAPDGAIINTMNVLLDLSPEEYVLLNSRAVQSNISIDAVLHSLIATLVSIPPTLPLHTTPEAGALLNSLHGADAIEDPEDHAEWEQEQAEMRANVARWRAEQGLGEGG